MSWKTHDHILNSVYFNANNNVYDYVVILLTHEENTVYCLTVTHFVPDAQGVVVGSWAALKGVGCSTSESFLSTVSEAVSSWQEHGPAPHTHSPAVAACVHKPIGHSHRTEACLLYEITNVVTARVWRVLEKKDGV